MSADVRHLRSGEFEQALREADPSCAGRRWTEMAADPNAAVALAARAELLRRAWRPPVRDRIAHLEARCHGGRVLDVGCVAHDVKRMSSPLWLHGRIAAVAESCVGVDVVEEGVAAMRDRGFAVELHDLREGLGPLEEQAPFDVIVAGELIEHVESLDMLFRTAVQGLAPDGELVVTTPNPYAPRRVRAAQLGIVWENVDHIMHAFPSGMAELAERHGLVLAEAAVSDDRARPGLIGRLKAVRRRVRGRHWVTVGFSTFGPRRVRRVSYLPLGRPLDGLRFPRRRFVGETFVYVIRRP